MRDNTVYQEYSADREYRFEVYRNQNIYEIWVQKKRELMNTWVQNGSTIMIYLIICTMQIVWNGQLRQGKSV